MATAYTNVAFDHSGSDSDEIDENTFDFNFVPDRETPKEWDKFRQTEDEAVSASEKNTDLIQKAYVALKIITIVIVFIFVATAAIVAKGSLFFIAAQTSFDRRKLAYCKSDLDYDVNYDGFDFEVVYDAETAVAWLW